MLPHIPADHVTLGIYIGSLRLTYYVEGLRQQGIKHVLKLYESGSGWPRDFTVLDNALSDGEYIGAVELRRGIDFLKEHVQAGDKVLVVCGAGISRSAAFVMAFLVEHGYSLPDAWTLLKANHPQANPHPKLWESLIIHFQLPYSVTEVLSWQK